MSKKPKNIGALIGAALAKIATTKKKKRTKKEKKSTALTAGHQRSGLMPFVQKPQYALAPATVGSTITAGAVRHKPVIVSGRCYGGFIEIDNLGGVKIGNAAQTAGMYNNFAVDPLGAGFNPNNFQLFPNTLRSLAGNFTRYRLNKLVVTGTALQPTTAPGTITFGCSPEVSSQLTNLAWNVFSILENSVTTSTWQHFSLNLLQSGGLRREWLFCDSQLPGGRYELRQVSPGQILCTNQAVTLGIITHQLWYDFEVEFDGMAAEAYITGESKASAALHERTDKSEDSSSSHISSSSSVPPLEPALLRGDTASPGYYMVREAPLGPSQNLVVR